MITSALREPFKDYQAFRSLHNKRKQRCISQLLNDLRDQLYHKQWQIPLPTNWLIDQLVDNALKNQHGDIINEENNIDAYYLLSQTLQQIIRDTQNTRCAYKCEDGKTSLFPNEELMDEAEVKEFAEGVLDFIEESH